MCQRMAKTPGMSTWKRQAELLLCRGSLRSTTGGHARAGSRVAGVPACGVVAAAAKCGSWYAHKCAGCGQGLWKLLCAAPRRPSTPLCGPRTAAAAAGAQALQHRYRGCTRGGACKRGRRSGLAQTQLRHTARDSRGRRCTAWCGGYAQRGHRCTAWRAGECMRAAGTWQHSRTPAAWQPRGWEQEHTVRFAHAPWCAVHDSELAFKLWLPQAHCLQACIETVPWRTLLSCSQRCYPPLCLPVATNFGSEACAVGMRGALCNREH
jgi:hypothetical protein